MMPILLRDQRTTIDIFVYRDLLVSAGYILQREGGK